MVNWARLSIERPLYPWLLALACFMGGLYGIDNVGRLEDPEFPIKNAYIITAYPGASAREVENEVTDIIEAALLQLPQLDVLTSKSVPGRSEVQVELQEHFGEGDIPQIWDELRRRVSEAQQRLPPGARTPHVEDDFGDVYGILYAFATPGYSAADVFDIARRVETTLKSVPGVAKVSTAGEPAEAIFVEIDNERLVRLGLPIDAVFRSINAENSVRTAGSVAYGTRRVRIAPELAFDSVEAVGNLRIGRPGSTEILRLADVATISRSPVEVPSEIIRFNGERVFSVGVSVTPGLNVVKVGEAVDARLAALMQTLPLGVTVAPVYRQHAVVSRSIEAFLQNLAISVATVIGALCLFMGWRAGAVVGSVLALTVLGTVWLMALLQIELQRISLGALMIAMGMLVDNAIVVAEGMVIGVRQGHSARDAAARSVARTQYALLGATVIGILAFAPIGLSDDNSGYFLRSLFQVVAISLLLSWVLAITVAPLLGSYLLVPREAEASVYAGWGYAPYRALIGWSLRHFWLASLAIVAITGSCLWGFSLVKQGFFPTTNTPLFFVDYYLPQGTDIHVTADHADTVSGVLRETPGVSDVTSFIGRGSTRFSATVRPEQPNPAYAHFVARVDDVAAMNDIMETVRASLADKTLDADLQIRRSEFTPSGTSKIEARFSGPNADVLRSLTEQALDVFLAHDLVDLKNDWRQRELQIVPHIDTTRARVAGIGRADVYGALAFGTLGVPIGLFRDADKLIPIVARAPADERLDLNALPDRMVWSPTQAKYIPMSQVVREFSLVPEDSVILRRDRVRTISAQANGPKGHNVTRVFDRIRGDVEAIELPPGYTLEWGGEFEASAEARELLTNKIPLTFGMMLLITIVMFGTLREPLVIWLTVPMTVCGVVISLLATDLSFTFPSFLGFLSLSGMLIKNCVVLVDEINQRVAEVGASLEVIAEASVSRLRPVMLAAGTTIAGMSPLLSDAFFLEMAVCIMGGLAFATLLTLVAVPVFYRMAFYRELRADRAAAPGSVAAGGSGILS